MEDLILGSALILLIVLLVLGRTLKSIPKRDSLGKFKKVKK